MAGAALIGREPELRVLTRWIRETAAGLGRPVLIEGEPGIGKSTLLQAARTEAVAAGCAVFWGTAEELGQSFPLLPLLTAFSIKPGEGDAVANAEALLAHIDQLCAQSPAVLVVDDLHWADPMTLALWRRLARSAAQRPLLLVGAMRGLPRRDEISALRRAVDPANQLRLQPLPAEASAELAANLAGGVPGPGLAKIAAGAAGNPLYLTEVVDTLLRSGRLTVEAGMADLTEAAAATPATLHEAIRYRLGFLPALTRVILQGAALLGTEFSIMDLAAVADRPLGELAPALADARACEVLVEVGDRLAFRHPLIRAALYDEMSVPVRTAWHRDAAQALHREGASASAVAMQLLPAVTELPHDEEVFLSPWVTGWLLDNAPTLVGQASAVAATLLREAASRIPARDRRRHQLTVYLARALAYQAAHQEVESLVAATLPYVADPDVLVDLYDVLVTARDASRLRLNETLAELEQAVVQPGLPDSARLRLTVLAARVEMKCGDLLEMAGRARQTLQTGIALHDKWAIGWMCNVLACSLWLGGDARQPLELLDQGLAATKDDPGLLDPYLVLLGNRGIFEGDLDLFERARGTLTDARRIAERTGKLGRAVQLQKSLGQVYFDHGQWDDSLAEVELPENVDTSNLFQAHCITAVILFHRGDPAARVSLAAAQRLAPQVQDQGQWGLTEAIAHEAAGDPQAALEVLALGLTDSYGLLDVEQWLADAVRLAMNLGDTRTAATATAQAEELAAGARQVPHRVALAAQCQGILRSDPHLLLEAADGYARLGRPLPQAQAFEAAAGQLAERGDVAAARPPFLAALEAYAQLGAEWDITRMRGRFRKHKLQPPTRLRRPASGWAALTATEAKVANLVALGWSNPEIAKELAVSRRTVETHVTHILAKLQLRSRIDIARAASSRADGD